MTHLSVSLLRPKPSKKTRAQFTLLPLVRSRPSSWRAPWTEPQYTSGDRNDMEGADPLSWGARLRLPLHSGPSVALVPHLRYLGKRSLATTRVTDREAPYSPAGTPGSFALLQSPPPRRLSM